MSAKIVTRLTKQLAARGEKDPQKFALALLKDHGILTSAGKLTAKGKKRNTMSPAQRAKDRAAKASGKQTTDYKYNKTTNRATLK